MINLIKLHKSFGSKTLFEDISFNFPGSGRLALVGANGVGKTTLLNIICELDQADGGSIARSDQLNLGYLPQKPNPDPDVSLRKECRKGAKQLIAHEQAMNETLARLEASPDNEKLLHQYESSEASFRSAGGYALDARIDEILLGLGFSTKQLDLNPTTLSGGWRMRLELAKLLLQAPDFLILDEPTNHLDLPSLVWFEKYLMQFEGTLLFVSHDYSLLNRLPTAILHLHKGNLSFYPGNFDSFLQQREEKQLLDQKMAAGLEKRRQHLEKFVARFGAKATKAKQAQSRVKMIARIRDLEADIDEPDVDQSIFINIPSPERPPRKILETKSATIGYGEPLANPINLLIERHQKIAIIGANGIGKSTFLKSIAERIPLIEGQIDRNDNSISYFEQDQRQSFDKESTVLDSCLERTEMGEKEVRSLLGGFLFRGDEVYKPIGNLSGGELSRVGLAMTIAQKANLLMLDEPTNHLDMSSVQTLAQALSDTDQTILFVSHDREFINAVASHIFVMLPDGRSRLFEGDLEDYSRMAERSGFPNVLNPEMESKADSGKQETKEHSDADFKELKRSRSQLQNNIRKLDSEITKFQSSLAKIDNELASANPNDYTALSELNNKRVELQSALESAEMNWLEAEDKLAEVESRIESTGRSID